MRINPCVESLKDMKPVDGGRYCSSCAKTIVDLTNKTNEEIRVMYDQNDGKLCGIVMPNQLQENRYYHPLKRFALALIIVFGTSLFVFANANGFNQFRNKAYAQLKQTEDKITIKGFVYGVGNPLVGAEVLVNINGLEYIAYTDVNGEFALEVPELVNAEMIIEYSHAGYKNAVKEYTVRAGMNKLFTGKVNLELDQENCIKGKIAVDPHEKEPLPTPGQIVLPPEEPLIKGNIKAPEDDEQIEIQTKGEIQAPIEGGIKPIDDDVKFD